MIKQDELIAERLAAKEAAREPLPAQTIVRNSMVTPDGTVLVSRKRHEYVAHEDANGFTYAVDGGRDYLRRSLNDEAPAEDTSVSLFHGHEAVREAYDWGTYGKDGDEELHYVLLKDMDEEHLQALIDDAYPATPLFIAEQNWRKSAGARKMVRKQDIERLMVMKDGYAHRPEVIKDLDNILEQIIPKFNSNEFDGEPQI